MEAKALCASGNISHSLSAMIKQACLECNHPKVFDLPQEMFGTDDLLDVNIKKKLNK